MVQASEDVVDDANLTALSDLNNQSIEPVTFEDEGTDNNLEAVEAEDNLSAAQEVSKIEAPSEVEYDVIGENFEVKLLTKDNKAISNAKVKFSVNGQTHESNTDSSGKASFQIRLDDGQYKLTTTFSGNSQYKACSKQTLITINNTRVVEEGLSCPEIQDIIDNAKANNVILFKGDIYEDINLMIDKRMVLIGNGNTILKSNYSRPIMNITGKTSSLTSVTGFNFQSDNGDGIVISNSDYVTINKNNISSKGNGIIAENVKYLEINADNIVGNGANGIVMGLAYDCNIINNKIESNSKNGVALSKSNNIYIYANTISKNQENGIYTSDELEGVYYGGSPSNLFIGYNEITGNKNNGIYLLKMGENLLIDSNTIKGNNYDGIAIEKASNNVNITSNVINNNLLNGISISSIASNNIFFNLIQSNAASGIKFNHNYIVPKNQDIRFNVIIYNPQNEIDASETGYDHVVRRLEIGENWYGGALNLCPKIKTDNINLEVTQVDSYLFNVTFYDSDGNIVNMLPSRIVTHKVNNGRSKSFVLYNGTGTFERDASDDDVIYVYVDMATYYLVYKFDDPTYLHLEYPPYSPHVRPIEDVGKLYPNLPRPGLLQDIPDDSPAEVNDSEEDNTQIDDEKTPEGDENSSQDSHSEGNGGYSQGNGAEGGNRSGSGNGNGGSSQGSGIGGNGGSFMSNSAGGNGSGASGNADVSANTDKNTIPGNGSALQSSSSNNNPSNEIGKSIGSPSSGAGPSAGSQSVVKRIIIDEEEAFKVTGLSLIILLILLTVAFYYRDDIKEIKAKI